MRDNRDLMLDTDTIVFTGSLLTIGRFRCPPGHPAWRTENLIGDRPVVVFPRVPVVIRPEHGAAVIADPNLVMFYNGRQRYGRGLLSERGDACEFFQVEDGVLREMIEPYDPAVGDRPQPFPFSRGPSDSRDYLIQRVLYESVTRAALDDALAIEEVSLRVLGSVVRRAYQASGHARPARPCDTLRMHEAIEATRTLLATRMGDPLTLRAIARHARCSPFHLARQFRRGTGSSIHAYRNRLRLRASLERIVPARTDLVEVALALGYSSHSHFTAAFRREFGAAPSAVRCWPARRIREVAERLSDLRSA